jgi:hypothetical protein
MSNTNNTHPRRNFYIAFSSILLLLNTVFFLESPYIGRLMWVTTRSTYPGGPFGYYNTEAPTNRVSLLGDAAQNLAITLNDGLLASFPRSC